MTTSYAHAFRRLTLLGGGLLLGVILGLSSVHAADTKYLLTTATTGGTYYPVGVALATLSKVKLQPKHKFGISAINSAGSQENVRLLRENEAQFALMQGLMGYYAWTGQGPIKSEGKQTELRSITRLWPNAEQIVVAARYVKTGTVADLAGVKGQRGGFGKKNSGAIVSNGVLMQNLGYDINEDFNLFYGGYGPSAEALQNAQVAVVSLPAGPPTGAVTRLFATAGSSVKPLSFTAAQAKQADGGLNIWSPYVIPAGTYPGIDKDWNTLSHNNFLAVRSDVPEQHVYLFTKAIYENLPFLNAIHPATKALVVAKALEGVPAPLHPGAERYYREAGVSVPPASHGSLGPRIGHEPSPPGPSGPGTV